MVYEFGLINEKIMGQIKVIKTDGETKFPLEDVVFELRDAEGTVIAELIKQCFQVKFVAYYKLLFVDSFATITRGNLLHLGNTVLFTVKPLNRESSPCNVLLSPLQAAKSAFPFVAGGKRQVKKAFYQGGDKEQWKSTQVKKHFKGGEKNNEKIRGSKKHF